MTIDSQTDASGPGTGASSGMDEGLGRGCDDNTFSRNETFESLGLHPSVLKGVEAMGFDRPTAIQADLIPPILAGRDVMGQAKTGTGKTAAFGLPLLHLAEPGAASQALILAPTRELAMQIRTEIDALGRHTPIRALAIFGGQRVSVQAEKLKKRPEIIVGTPGRVMDMIERGLLSLKGVRFAVLDEVDRMLDIGFREDIRKILSRCPRKRQTIFVSATISSDIERLARSYMHDPEKIVTTSGSLTVQAVDQYHLTVQPWDKRRLLAHLLTHEEPALTLVFCRLKRMVDQLSRYLTGKGIEAHAIHADLPQSKRNAVMQKFRGGKMTVLIASDLASRGIDVEGISHVINYDLPDDIELYVHRIGRTARVGRRGVAWSFVTPDQGRLLTDIERLINAEIPKLDYDDFKPGPLPPDEQARRNSEEQRRQRATDGPGRLATPEVPKRKKQAADPTRFPGGVVPTKAPPKRMQGRVRTRRGR